MPDKRISELTLTTNKTNALVPIERAGDNYSFDITDVPTNQATTAEINTGTDSNKYIVSDQLEASKYLNQSGSKISATASGTNTYTATISPAITAYSSSQRFFILFTNANTGAATLNLNGLGAKSIVKEGNLALVTGDIPAGSILCVAYDGTNFQIVNTRAKYYTLALGYTAVFAPNDASVYYFSFGLTPATGDAHSGSAVPLTGVVEKVGISSRASGTVTTETSTFTLYQDGGSVGVISNDYAMGDGGSGNFQAQFKTGLSLAVTEGRHLSIKWDTPTWATNPTNSTFYFTLLIRIL